MMMINRFKSKPIFIVYAFFFASIFLISGCEKLSIFGKKHSAPSDLLVLSVFEQTQAVDEDKNGIGDIVDDLISNSIDSGVDKIFWKDYAKSLQSVFQISILRDSSDTSRLIQSFELSKFCLLNSDFDDQSRQDIIFKIHALTFDSALKKDLWYDFQSMLPESESKFDSVDCSKKR